MIIIDVYLVPDFEKNLLFVTRLFKHGFSLNFNNAIKISKNGDLITTVCIINNLYYTNSIFLTIYDTETNTDVQRDSKRLKFDSTDLACMWHLILGHIILDRNKRLVKEGLLESSQVRSLLTCEFCLEEKMTKRSFTAKGTWATQCLVLIYSGVYGLLNVQARGYYESFISFTNNCSFLVKFI